MRYTYLALDPQGQAITGLVTATGERDAARQLQRQDLTLLELRATTQVAMRHARGKPKARELLVLLHELATLLESGVALIEAVESLADSSHHPLLTQACIDLAARLRHGESFSAALRVSKLNLPWFVTQLVESGELTGKVGSALRDGVNQMEYEQRINSEMRNALIYPSILVISGISAVLLIFVLVVPKFADILANRGNAEVPWLAQAVLSTGLFFNAYIYWIVGISIVLSMGVAQALRNRQWRARGLDLLVRAPLVGEWILEAETGRWAAMMGTLLDNRVPLLHALELAQDSIRLPGLRARMSQVTKAVRGGASLAQALMDQDALTATGHNLIRAGERAGALPRMLKSLAKLLEESGQTRMKRFLLLLEPIAILFIGGAIGVIITGVVLAITSINQINL